MISSKSITKLINSKNVKIFCFVAMILAFLACAVMLIFGFVMLADDNTVIGIVLLVMAVIFPFMTSIALYPIYALSNIEETLTALDQKTASFLSSFKDYAEEGRHTADTNAPCSVPVSAVTSQKSPRKSKTYEEALDFINQKHGLSVSLTDDLDTIKEKIDTIDDGGFTAIIFKRKVSEATTKDEIESIFVMHTEEYD